MAANWITLSQSAGTGNATVTFTASYNGSSVSARSATLRFKVSRQTVDVAISQAKKPAVIDYILISGPDYYTLPYSGGGITSGTVKSDLIIYAHYDNYPAGQGFVDVTSASTIGFDRAQVSASCTTNTQIEMKDWFYVSASYSGISTNKTVWIYQEGVPETNRLCYSASTPIVFTYNAINNFEANIIASGYSNGSGIYVFDGPVKRFYGNASCMITPETKGALTGIDVPSSLTSLGQNVFNGCSALTTVNGLEYTENVYLPPENAGNGAFYNCTSLTHCGLPHSYQYWSGGAIKADVFYGCSSLTTIIYNGTMTEWNAISKNSNWRRNSAVRYVQCTDGTIDLDAPTSNTIIYNASEQLAIPDSAITPSITSHTYTNGVGTIKASGDITSINASGFSNNSSMTSIDLPDNLETINGYAFASAVSLTNISIPDNVTDIDRYAFWHCSGLTSVNVPTGVTTINASTFSYCTSLTSITMPNVTKIVGLSFYKCTSLPEITLPSTLIEIGNQAFYQCSALATINYDGTMAQWSNVSKAGSWYAYGPATVVHCTDGDVNI